MGDHQGRGGAKRQTIADDPALSYRVIDAPLEAPLIDTTIRDRQRRG